MAEVAAAAVARDKSRQRARSAATRQSAKDEYLRTLSVDLASFSWATLSPENQEMVLI